MILVGNNSAATNFDTIFFNTESAVHVFDATAAEETIAAIGGEASCEALRRNFCVTALFFMPHLFFSCTRNTA